jgi:hypothetical protein
MSIITETKLEFAKLGSRIGAEIRGFDVSGDLSPETVGPRSTNTRPSFSGRPTFSATRPR